MIKAFFLCQSQQYTDVNQLREAVSEETAKEAAPENTMEAASKEDTPRKAAEAAATVKKNSVKTADAVDITAAKLTASEEVNIVETLTEAVPEEVVEDTTSN